MGLSPCAKASIWIDFTMPITVALADDQRLFCAGCRTAFDTASGIQVVGEVHDFEAAVDLLASNPPQVLLLDLTILGESPEGLLPALKEKSPSTSILAVASCCSQVKARALLAIGCDGLVDKAADPEELRAAVSALSRGRQFISLLSKDSLLFSYETIRKPHVARQGSPAALSEREESVLSMIARGLTNQQIADELFLSVKTIETYRARLQRKLGVRGRADLYNVAMSRGLMSNEADSLKPLTQEP